MSLVEIASLITPSDPTGARSGEPGISAARLGPSGDLLAAGFSFGTVKLYVLQDSPRADKGTVIFTAKLHEVRVGCLCAPSLSRKCDLAAPCLTLFCSPLSPAAVCCDLHPVGPCWHRLLCG